MAKTTVVKSILLSAVCFTVALAVAFSGVAYGRYNRVAFCSVVCGAPEPPDSTLTAQGAVYDFGTWQVGQTAGYAHTVVLQSEAPLQGTLRFTWDDETRQKADVAALPAGNAEGTGGSYTVKSQNGKIEFPFELIFSSTTRFGQAVLDVAFIPQGAETASHTARYLVVLNPYSQGQGQNPAVGNNTAFLTNRLLCVSATAPADCNGLLVSAGQDMSHPFAEGTTYYTQAYPQGVTLLKSSLLYLPAAQNGAVDAVLDYMQPVTGAVGLAMGRSQSSFAVAHAVPITADAVALAAAGEAIVSRTQAFTANLRVADTLPDPAWNTAGDGAAQLVWQVEQLQNGVYIPVELSPDLTATVAQSATEGTITLAAPTGRQAAGTYRLKCTQTYNGQAVATAYLWFFIDYRM